MPCYKPLQAFQGEGGAVSWNPGYGKRSLQLPCGRCIGCRLKRSQQWAARCMHEAQLHDENCFITLTYDDQHLPEGGSLDRSVIQKFFKRLRERVQRRVSVFYCGEYGEDPVAPEKLSRRFGLTGLGRPHYHALLFGFDFPDKLPWKKDLFRSPLLEQLWPFGFSSIGAVTYESAGYCAGYALKKVFGEEAPGWYMRVDKRTGECFELLPEFAGMSLRPALGREWYRRFKSEVWQDDSVVCRGREFKPPRYYSKLLEAEDPAAYELVMQERNSHALDENNSWARLRVREQVKLASLSSKKGAL